MTVRSRDAKGIFLEAVEKETAHERRQFLDEACGSDAELRARVEELLASLGDAGSFMEKKPGAEFVPTCLQEPITEQPGTVIGRYKLLQEIGEGGFGVVYMAEQAEPVRRKVALKIIKPGMDSKQVIARFEAERRALALMDHPNIAKVLDAGATDSGRPYFVMELVKGTPLVEFCDSNKLATDARLELFVTICRAVQHAHHKGIIHRDLKPSNVMVTLIDNKPVPKVIDFGVSKAISQQLTEKTLFTAYGQMIGTPAYMSPEQAQMTGLDVDTRCDIYSLGVMLYELVTGSTPIEAERLRGTAYAEVQRLICEEEPPKPSTRLSTKNEALPTIAQKRSIEPQKLTQFVRGDLDWIVMKALQKERNRRYDTANSFADDTQRFLNNDAVEACPPSVGYKFRKFARRNKAILATVTTIALILVAASIVSTSLAVWAMQQRQIAWKQQRIARSERDQKEAARQQAQANEQKALKAVKEKAEAFQQEAEQRKRAEEAVEREQKARQAEADQRRRAERATDEAKAVSQYLVKAFRKPDPSLDGRKITIAEMLDQAVHELKQDFRDRPLVEASLLMAIGETYYGLGLWTEALEVSKRAYDLCQENGDGDIDVTLNAKNGLARAHLEAGNLNEAIALFKEILEVRRERHGEAEVTLGAINNLAVAYLRARDYQNARVLLEEAREAQRKGLWVNASLRLNLMNNLASAYAYAGEQKLALPLCREVLKRLREHEEFGEKHPSTIRALGNLGAALSRAGKLDEALPRLKEAFELSRATLGVRHPNTLMVMSALGLTHAKNKEWDLAVRWWQDELGIWRETVDHDHPRLLFALNNLGSAYMHNGDFGEAERLLEKAVELARNKFGPSNQFTVTCTNNLVRLHVEQAGLVPSPYKDPITTKTRVSPDSMEEHFERARELSLRQLRDLAQKPLTVRAKLTDPAGAVAGSLAMALMKKERFDECHEFSDAVCRMCTKYYGPSHPNTQMLRLVRRETAVSLIRDCRLQKKYNKAESLCLALLKDLRDGPLFPIKGRRVKNADAIAELALIYELWGKLEKGKEQAGLLLELRRKANSSEPAEFASALEQMANILLKQGQHAEAEPICRELLAIREKKRAQWQRWKAKSLLGDALTGQAARLKFTDPQAAAKKFAEAEPLLIESWEGMRKRKAKVDSAWRIRLNEALTRIRLAEALQRLVVFYEARAADGDSQQAAKWKAELEKSHDDQQPKQGSDATQDAQRSAARRTSMTRTEEHQSFLEFSEKCSAIARKA